MPALIWVAFWSSMMGAATCWREAVLPTRPKLDGSDRSPRSAGRVAANDIHNLPGAEI